MRTKSSATSKSRPPTTQRPVGTLLRDLQLPTCNRARLSPEHTGDIPMAT